MFIIWIIVAILIFSFVVIIHELWHFTAARKFWVRVEEFGLGLPPKAKNLYKDKKGTQFTLNWLPLWGFVRLTWENPYAFDVFDENKKLYKSNELEKAIKEWKDVYTKDWQKLHKSEKEEILKKLEENKADYNLMKKPIWQQSIVILAWVFMNFLLAVFIFFVLFLFWVKPIWINDTIKMKDSLLLIPTFEEAIDKWIIYKASWVMLSPIKWSVAEQAWLLEWDVVNEVKICESDFLDIETCKWWEEMQKIKILEAENLMNAISQNAWKEILLLVNEEKRPKHIAILVPEEWKIWTYLWWNLQINEDFRYKFSIIDSAKYAVLETKNQVILTFKWIWYLFDKIISPDNPEERQEAMDSMSWPIWIVDFISSSLKAWWVFMIVFMAIISINLWVFNLLPIPALDWWRFLFIVVNWISEKLFKKKLIWETSEAIVHFIFFMLLIALSILIAYNDIIKIFADK